jgi:hypothetical protein
MDRDAIFVQVCAALFAAYRTDKHATTADEDVARTLDEARTMTAAIVDALPKPKGARA